MEDEKHEGSVEHRKHGNAYYACVIEDTKHVRSIGSSLEPRVIVGTFRKEKTISSTIS